jgi:hypothetical protein
MNCGFFLAYNSYQRFLIFGLTRKTGGVDLVDKAKPAARQGRKASGLP